MWRLTHFSFQRSLHRRINASIVNVAVSVFNGMFLLPSANNPRVQPADRCFYDYKSPFD
jgi:hypothetical protein